jgi:cell division protein ZipA
MNIDMSLIAISVVTVCSMVVFVGVIAKMRRSDQHPEYQSPEVGDLQDITFDEGIVSGPRIIEQNFSALNDDGEPKTSFGNFKETPRSAVLSSSKTSKTNTSELMPNKIMVLHVMAQTQAFSGYQLLQALLGLGLRYGEMNIFHRHQELSGRGKILFSLASATEPGTFDLDNMNEYSCVGVTLFMDITRLEKPMIVFNILLETARQLAKKLDGVLQDERRQILNEQLVNEYKQRIRVLIAA